MALIHQISLFLLLTCSILHSASAQKAAAAADSVCLLKLTIDPKQSPWTGGGTTSAPIEGKVSGSKLNATGHVWLRVPSTGSCPPTNLTADNVDDLLQQSSLEVPVGSSSMTFKPGDIKNKVTPLDPGAPPLANMDFLGLDLGLSGTEPLGPGTVTVAQGTAGEAKAAAQKVCSQLLMLNGTLDLSSRVVGPRTADVKHVAYNRSLAAGVSVAQKGKSVGNAVLYLSNVTLFLNISPESKDGQGTPGVEFSRAQYTLTGDVVAKADLSKASSWQSVPADKVAWGTIRRKDAPLVIGSNRPGKPRYLGDNSTVEQQCKPTRVLDGAGGTTAAASEPAAKRSAAQHAVFGFTQALLTAALACGAAAALLL